MKILIIQERSRHKANQEFRECLNLSRAFSRMGVENVVWGLNFETFDIPFERIVQDCDVILLLENYDSNGWVPDMSMCRKMKIFWSIDSHWNLREHLKTCEVQGIDILLNSTDSYLHFFQKPGRKCEWFPNCYPADLIKPIEGIQKQGIGFCGNIINRGYWIEELRQTVGMRFDNFVLGQAMVEAVNSYAIGWNRNIKDDINYRTSEVLGCRTFLLTNETDRLSDLYDIGKHLVTYTTLEDCIEKIRYYLTHDAEREAIQNAGYEHARTHHTYDQRAQLFLEIIGA